MRRGWILNLILLAVVGTLAALVWWPRDEGTDGTTPPVTTLARDAVQRIEIVRSGDTLVLERDGDGRWWLAGDPRLPADGAKVESVLALAAAPSLERYPVKGLELAQFGLAPPRATVRMGGVEIALGDTEPLSGRRYVRVGDTLHLVADTAFSTVTGERAAWISPQLVPEGARIEAIALPGGVRLRRGDSGWTMEPAAEGVAPEAIADFADEWRLARAFETELDEGPVPAGDAVVLTLEGLGERRFVIVEREPELVLRRADLPVRYRFTRFSAERLLRPPRAAQEGDDEG